ncbi:DUF4124 domain-containing protein [Aliivibrio sifiae]|uniref:DUF4124 domain-containing protein n=1 Tax=Aliivibrio sifiae TaxID=566293 RepID=UPI000769E20E
MLHTYIILLFVSLFSLPAMADAVYTWEDSKGIRHFSDTPPPSSVKSKQLSFSSTPNEIENIPVPSASKKTTTKKTRSKSKETLTPLDISISNLSQEETIRSSRGHIMVLTDLTRKLTVGEKLQLILDGSPYGLPQTSREWKLTNIERGTHIITVVAQKDGKRIASSKILTVHLHRPSKL